MVFNLDYIKKPRSAILADVSVVPSKVKPFGLVAIEATACGTHVVAINAGGLPDFVTEEVGTLVKMDDHEGLAYAILEEIRANAELRLPA